MAWEIEWQASAVKQLEKLGKHEQRTLLKYLRERIATNEDPRRFGKPLKSKLKGLWRYRVGDFRIICRIEDHRLVVLVVGLGHRSNVYEGDYSEG